MSVPANDVHSSEDARKQAEWHRREIAHTLDELSARLNTTMDRAQEQVQKPLHWMRRHPYATLAISGVLGFVLAGTTRRRRRAVLTRELDEAYRLGRQDEVRHHPVREHDFWTEAAGYLESHQGRPPSRRPESSRGLMMSLAQPMLSTLGSILAGQLASRWQR